MKTQETGLTKPNHSQDFRFILQDELVKRCKKNPSYSLRAFAKSLDVNHAALSQIINGKRKLSNKMIEKLGQSLALSPAQLKKYFKNELPEIKDSNYEQMAQDTFLIISDWYHFAILELMKTKGFKPEAKFISKALGITASEANIAIERLQRVGLISLDENNCWKDNTNGHSWYGTESSTASARKKLQEQTFELALKALSNVSNDKRSHSGITMAIDSSKIEGARELIREFRRRLCDYLSAEESNCDSVYHLSLALFPLTKNLNNLIEDKNENT